jgi:hypothetical protein
VITGYLVGDEEVLTRLRAIPDAANAGIARAITKLGLDLQQRAQKAQLSDQTPIDLSFEQSGNRIAATIFSGGAEPVKSSLQRARQTFGRPISAKVINLRASRRGTAPPQGSFLRSALDDMGPAIQDEVDVALREAFS